MHSNDHTQLKYSSDSNLETFLNFWINATLSLVLSFFISFMTEKKQKIKEQQPTICSIRRASGHVTRGRVMIGRCYLSCDAPISKQSVLYLSRPSSNQPTTPSVFLLRSLSLQLSTIVPVQSSSRTALYNDDDGRWQDNNRKWTGSETQTWTITLHCGSPNKPNWAMHGLFLTKMERWKGVRGENESIFLLFIIPCSMRQ